MSDRFLERQKLRDAAANENVLADTAVEIIKRQILFVALDALRYDRVNGSGSTLTRAIRTAVAKSRASVGAKATRRALAQLDLSKYDM